MNKFISVIVPNYNGSKTIGKCLEALMSSKYYRYEIIIVDDGSSDNSIDIISKFPCRLVRLDKRTGAAKARNAGARESTGEILFFIDSDCIVSENTLSLVHEAIRNLKDTVIGGTYSPLPYDSNFFSIFQSIYINYSELKWKEPDYIATHAMAIEKRIFEASGGFSELFFPIIEDVEFSHRLQRSGYKLLMAPDIIVQHIFNFTFWKSLKNAFRKSHYWIMYSLGNNDIFKNSGTASQELKINVFSNFLIMLLLLLYFSLTNTVFILLLLLISGINLYINRNLLKAFYRAKGLFFALPASLYYMLIYPLAVGAGSFTGIMQYLKNLNHTKNLK